MNLAPTKRQTWYSPRSVVSRSAPRGSKLGRHSTTVAAASSMMPSSPKPKRAMRVASLPACRSSSCEPNRDRFGS